MDPIRFIGETSLLSNYYIFYIYIDIYLYYGKDDFVQVFKNGFAK